MKRITKYFLIGFGILLTILIFGPFVVPVPSLEGVDADKLADADSQFIEINGITLHYKQYGQGEPIFILLHGTLATTYTWHEVIEPLAQMGTVIAYDRPAFGLSDHPMPGEWLGEGPYGHEAQADMVIALMDALGIERAILIGNSLGGGIAGLAAQRHPQRVEALVLADPVQNRHGISIQASWLFSTPQMRRIGPLFLRNNITDFAMDLYKDSWHDPNQVDQEDIDTYSKIFQTTNWDRGLWELIIAARPFESVLQYNAITVPTLVITGDDDWVLGTTENINLTDKIPQADLEVISNCGHIPQEECPEQFMEAVTRFLSELSHSSSD